MVVDLAVHSLPVNEIHAKRNYARRTLDEWEEQGYLTNDPNDEIERELKDDIERCEIELLRRNLILCQPALTAKQHY